MSRRTFEASKAITAAWVKEKLLVDDGKGTRDWTPDQQADIQNKGKAYDENGKAYQGHHMKSAEAYPEYQGDADNIQVLTASEHSAAHNNGNYSIPTNGCYDPITGITKDFGSNIYEPCEVIELTNPITNKNDFRKNENDGIDRDKTRQQHNNDSKGKNSINTTPISQGILGRAKNRVTKIAARFGVETKADFWHFVKRNSLKAAIVTVPIVADAVVKTLTSERRERSSDSYGFDSDVNYDTDYKIYDDADGDNEQIHTNHADRSSPEEHTVKGHTQRYHTKDGIIEKEKNPYPRGKK